MQVQRRRSIGRQPIERMVQAFVRLRATGILVLLAVLAVSAPLQAAPAGLTAPFSVSDALHATYLSDAAKNDAVMGFSRQIEAIRRMPVLAPSRALMRSDTTHMGLAAKDDQNMADFAVKMPMTSRLVTRLVSGPAGVAVRAPPMFFL